MCHSHSPLLQSETFSNSHILYLPMNKHFTIRVLVMIVALAYKQPAQVRLEYTFSDLGLFSKAPVKKEKTGKEIQEW